MSKERMMPNNKAQRALLLGWLMTGTLLMTSSGCIIDSSKETTSGGGGSGAGDQGGGAGGQGGESSVVCGDGVVTSAEGCDDGNTDIGDGCSADCTVEPGYDCIGAPSACSDIDECAQKLDNCDENATCTNTPGSFGCVCKPGYAGDGLTCTNIDDCSFNPCQNGGTCTDGISGYTCSCPSGYAGLNCEVALSIMIAAGEAHSLALKNDGSVWAWGSNSSGQLGVPGSHLTPVQVAGL